MTHYRSTRIVVLLLAVGLLGFSGHRRIFTKRASSVALSAITVPCITASLTHAAVETFNVTCADTAFGTPKAVLTWWTLNADGSTNNLHANIGVGFATSSTADWVGTFYANSNGATTLTSRRQMADEVLGDITSSANVDGEANVTAFIDDGVTYDQANGVAAATRFHSIVFGGADFSAVAGTISSNASVAGTTESASLGFAPQVILFSSIKSASNDSALTDVAAVCVGVAVKNDGQGSAGYHATGGGLDTSAVGMILSTQYACAHVSDAAAVQAIEVTTFGADTFTITTRVATGALTYGFLAINIGNRTPFFHAFDTQGSTGNVAVTGLGVTPSFVGLITSTATAVNTLMTGNDAAFIGLSLFSSETNAGTIGFRDLDEQDSTSAETYFHTQPLWSEVPVNTDFLKATFTSLDADGFTLNYATTVTGKKAFAWGWN